MKGKRFMPEKLTPEDLVVRGRSIFSRSKNARDVIERRWARSNDLYDSIFPNDKKKMSDVLLGQWKLFIPKTYNTTQRIHVDVMDTFCFDNEEYVEITQRPDIDDKKRLIIKAVCNHRLNGHPVNYYQEIFEATQDGLKNKVGILKIFPKLRIKNTEKKTQKQDENGEVVEIVEPDVEVTAFEPRIDCVPPEDLYIDPRFSWKDYWKYPMVHKFTRTRQQFKEMGYKNVDEAQALNDASLGDEVKTQRNLTYGSPFFNPSQDKNKDVLVAYEFWDFYDINNDGYEESVTYTMLGSTLEPHTMALEMRENTLPYKFSEFECVRPPFVIGQPFPEAHKGYGKDLPEFTEPLQMETIALRNQDREATALSIRKPLLVNKDAGIDMQALVNRKLGGIVVGEETGPDAVREIQTSAPMINTAPISRAIDNDYYEATSITPGQLGLSNEDKTATGVASDQDNANKKIAGIIRNYKYTLVLPTMQYLLRLEQAYETDEYIRNVTGQTLGWNLPNDGTPAWSIIQGDFELNPDATLNKQTQVNRYLLLLDRMNQANLSMTQLLQSGVVDPKNVKFANPMWAFDQLLRVLKIKNTESAKIQALPPTPQEAKGVASQPGVSANPFTSVNQMNPEAFVNELS